MTVGAHQDPNKLPLPRISQWHGFCRIVAVASIMTASPDFGTEIDKANPARFVKNHDQSRKSVEDFNPSIGLSHPPFPKPPS